MMFMVSQGGGIKAAFYNTICRELLGRPYHRPKLKQLPWIFTHGGTSIVEITNNTSLPDSCMKCL